ncbi:2-oxo-4-hydroxy-4-carboxy-5-ureidoimidazoline decarboxylase (plasmid) [Klebsiella sp. B345]|uniref:2-oxo-4-hydroxy-4-carboxy-5-ureidoimidazoline decarboxylase n=1 Tax=Klebsiella sp. B345 TaxID=2755398 RepID=UPI003DA7AB2F
MIALNRFNRMAEDEAMVLLTPCVAVPEWSTPLICQRPYANRADLLQVARQAMHNWGEKELNQALCAHPRIGEKPTETQAHAVLSRQEQSGVDHSDDMLSQALKEGNALYEECFGRLFLIRAKRRSGEEILQALMRRLQYSNAEDMQEALEQLREITLLRLEGMISE